MDRLEQVKQEREQSLDDAKDMWSSIRESVNNANRNINMLNASVIMLGHTMGTLLSNIDKLTKNNNNNSNSTNNIQGSNNNSSDVAIDSSQV